MRSVLPTMFILLALPVLALSQGPGSSSPCSNESTQSDKVVLTVCWSESGMTREQSWYNLRLFSDGRADYEGSDRADPKLVRKDWRITRAEMQEILRLGRASDFQRANGAYQPLVHKTDSSSLTVLVFNDRGKTKRIALSNFNALNPANGKHYPKSVLAMMERVEKIRRSAL